MHQNSNPPPPPMVSNCISKGYCPKEIEEPYPLITFCTLKHIPEQGGGGRKKKKRERFFGENSKEKKMKAGRLNYKRRLKNTKHYFTKG